MGTFEQNDEFSVSNVCPAESEEPQPVQPLSALRPVPGQDVPARGQAGLPATSPSAERTQPSLRPPAQQEDHQGEPRCGACLNILIPYS